VCRLCAQLETPHTRVHAPTADETLKSALNVSTELPAVHSSTLQSDTLPSKVLVLNTPGVVGLHCGGTTEQLKVRHASGHLPCSWHNRAGADGGMHLVVWPGSCAEREMSQHIRCGHTKVTQMSSCRCAADIWSFGLVAVHSVRVIGTSGAVTKPAHSNAVQAVAQLLDCCGGAPDAQCRQDPAATGALPS
jgi:hypothetical protein